MGSIGDSYDNALMENFWSTLKIELVYRNSWRTRDEAENAIFAYIDGWYNTRRIQKELGYLSPDEYETAWHTHQAQQTEAAIVTLRQPAPGNQPSVKAGEAQRLWRRPRRRSNCVVNLSQLSPRCIIRCSPRAWIRTAGGSATWTGRRRPWPRPMRRFSCIANWPLSTGRPTFEAGRGGGQPWTVTEDRKASLALTAEAVQMRREALLTTGPGTCGTWRCRFGVTSQRRPKWSGFAAPRLAGAGCRPAACSTPITRTMPHRRTALGAVVLASVWIRGAETRIPPANL